MRPPDRTAAYATYLIKPAELLELLGIPAGEIVSCCPESKARQIEHIQVTVQLPLVQPGGPARGPVQPP